MTEDTNARQSLGNGTALTSNKTHRRVITAVAAALPAFPSLHPVDTAATALANVKREHVPKQGNSARVAASTKGQTEDSATVLPSTLPSCSTVKKVAARGDKKETNADADADLSEQGDQEEVYQPEQSSQWTQKRSRHTFDAAGSSYDSDRKEDYEYSSKKIKLRAVEVRRRRELNESFQALADVCLSSAGSRNTRRCILHTATNTIKQQLARIQELESRLELLKQTSCAVGTKGVRQTGLAAAPKFHPSSVLPLRLQPPPSSALMLHGHFGAVHCDSSWLPAPGLSTLGPTSLQHNLLMLQVLQQQQQQQQQGLIQKLSMELPYLWSLQGRNIAGQVANESNVLHPQLRQQPISSSTSE